MTKVLLPISSLMICAVIAACGGNTETTDSIAVDSTVIEQTEVAEPACLEANNDARQQAIDAAIEKICGSCTEKDMMACLDKIIDESFAEFAQDAEFKAAVKAGVKNCAAQKVKEVAVEKGKEAAKEGAKKGIEEGIKALKK